MAESAERYRAKRKMLPFDRRQSDPSRGQDASELAMREERDVAFQRVKMGDEPVSTVGNLRGRFAARTTVPKHIQSGRSLIYLYDDNHVTLSAGTDITFTEDRARRFEVAGSAVAIVSWRRSSKPD